LDAPELERGRDIGKSPRTGRAEAGVTERGGRLCNKAIKLHWMATLGTASSVLGRGRGATFITKGTRAKERGTIRRSGKGEFI